VPQRRTTLLPQLPRVPAAPWILTALSAGTLAYGLVEASDGAVVLGVAGLAFIALAYGVARVFVRSRDNDPDGDV
jgi:hypothetical protein